MGILGGSDIQRIKHDAISGNEKDMIVASKNYISTNLYNIPSVETELININGSGFIAKIGGYSVTGTEMRIKVYVDDELLFDFITQPTSRYIEFGNRAVQSVVDLNNFKDGNISTKSVVLGSLLKFSRNLRILASSNVTDDKNYVLLNYGLMG
ncbi:hypothetical protein [Anaerotignum sp.]|uniref:hypothetical protein n=1 Tax=Anaerotignum sp. TaxID=2039241 RepID=UPI0033191685